MKLPPVTTLNKRNKITPKRFDVDAITENYDVITIFPIYDQLKTENRTENRTKKSLTLLSHYCFE